MKNLNGFTDCFLYLVLFASTWRSTKSSDKSPFWTEWLTLIVHRQVTLLPIFYSMFANILDFSSFTPTTILLSHTLTDILPKTCQPRFVHHTTRTLSLLWEKTDEIENVRFTFRRYIKMLLIMKKVQVDNL